MAISVNDVYQTTLTLLNKEQRGYVTPTEFNQIAGVVQNEVFEGYFQKAGVPENMDSELADIGTQYREKLQPFITHADLQYTGDLTFKAIQIDDFYRALDFYPQYQGVDIPIKADRVNSMTANKVNLSPLVAPTKYNPIVVLETEVDVFNDDNELIGTYPGYRIYPDPVSTEIHYIRVPRNPSWVGATVNGQVVPSPTSSNYQDFELHISDYSEVIARVLGYFGLNVRDPEVQQTAAAEEQQNSAI